jgi:hypothetical protein
MDHFLRLSQSVGPLWKVGSKDAASRFARSVAQAADAVAAASRVTKMKMDFKVTPRLVTRFESVPF